MQQGQASVTAQRVAALRLSFERVATTYGDGDAEDRLARDVAGSVSLASSPMERYLRARTAFFDRVVVAALERGVSQVIVTAAGYDGRALRYAKPGVRWFELDHPATQADKRERLDRLGIDTPAVTFVAADFAVDDVAGRLRAAGVDTTRASLILVEGVAVYLDMPVLESLLGALRSVGGPSSRLAISLSVDTGSALGALRRAAFKARVAAVGEPARSVLTADGADELFERTGWKVDDASSDRARAAGLLVVEPAA